MATIGVDDLVVACTVLEFLLATGQGVKEVRGAIDAEVQVGRETRLGRKMDLGATSNAD